MKKLWVLVMAAGLMGSGALVRADEPKKPATPVAKAPAVKDDPLTPAIKGADEKAKAKYVALHEGFMKDKAELLKKGPIQFVALGDSITNGWRNPLDPKSGKGGKEVWDAAFGKYNAFNTGIGGDRTQHVLWRIDNGELDGITPKVAMLMIGTNNVPSNPDADNVAAGVKACVDDIRKHLPQTKVLLLAIFPRDPTPDSAKRKEINQINQMLAKLDDGKMVKYLDIGPKFLDKDGNLPKEIMPDALHPNAKGYQIWADAVTPVIEEMMK